MKKLIIIFIALVHGVAIAWMLSQWPGTVLIVISAAIVISGAYDILKRNA